MRVNLYAAILAAVLSAGSFGAASAQEAEYFRPVALDVIDAGCAATAPCEASAGPGCASPVEPGCAAPAEAACGADDNGCDDGCGACGWFANVESVFLMTTDGRNDHSAFVGIADILNASANLYDSSVGSLDNNLMASPRATLGYQGQCYGALVRFWSLNDTATAFDPLLSVPNAGDPLGFSAIDRLKMYTVDAEVTREFCWNDWTLLGSLGVRYGDWESDFRISAVESINTLNLTTASALSGIEFKGFGVTGALGGYRQVNCCSGLGWFWNARASYLWGRHESFAQVTGASVDLTGSVLTDNVAFAAFDGNAFIGEFQLGAQWEHELKCINARAFVRVAGELQYWDGEDVATAIAAGVGATNLGGYVGSASAGDPNMTLFGFNIGTGITY